MPMGLLGFRRGRPLLRQSNERQARAIKPYVRYVPALDNYRRRITDDPTPKKFAAWLTSVDDGDIAALVEMTEEMVAKDAHLFGVANTRRAAVTALDWKIEPNPDDPDTGLAEAKADYCRERLMGITNFSDCLDHLAEAIGPNIAVLELLWDKAELSGIVPVPGHRLTGDPEGRRPGVFVETEYSLGIPTRPGKWVVYTPQPNGGFPFRKTLIHATIWPWLMMHFSRADWMAFSELYGQPLRIIKWSGDVSSGDRTVALEMIQNMNSDTAAGFPEGIQPELMQVSGSGETFVNQTAWAEKKMSIAWLGQTLTTDTQGVGSFALGKVHDNVRADLLASDLRAEKRTIEGQLLAPMCSLKFPDNVGPCPTWKRTVVESRDYQAEQLAIQQLQAAQQLGIPTKRDQVYEILGLERPAPDDTDVMFTTPAPIPSTTPPRAGG